MEVIDNFLHKEIFDPMQVTMLGYAFPWFYNSDIVDENDRNELFQFVHLFFLLIKTMLMNIIILDFM